MITVKEFMRNLRASMTKRAWDKLRNYARRGLVRWGSSPEAAGPLDGKGG